jgi:hypothetical protein
MVIDFQQALADLTASPQLCIQVRSEPAVLRARYNLTEREWQRLVGIVQHPGMACACIVYRANRLAPLALNLPQTCRALGAQLRDVASDYWAAFPEGNVHFYVEAERFCRYLQERVDAGEVFAHEVKAALAHEAETIEGALRESHTEALFS